MTLRKRLKLAGIAILKSFNIAFLTCWLSLLFIISEKLADKPTGRQFISSYVGGASYYGHRWAKIIEWFIDRLAILVGDKPRHCYRAWKYYRDLDN